MDNLEEKNNLSETRIYDLLKVKNPKKFHIEQAKNNISKSIDLIRLAQKDLSLILFPKNKKINRLIIQELNKQLHNTSWYLLNLLEAVSTYQNIKQNQNWLSNDDLKNLFESLQNPGELL